MIVKWKFILAVAGGIIWALTSISPCQAQLTCTETMFDDVDVASVGLPFCHFIESFAALGITGGCSTTPPLFCPNNYVTRGQMAVFLTTALDLAVSTGQAESITSEMIRDGTITNADISTAAGIDISKLSGIALASHTHSANDITSGTASGAVTFSNASNVFIGTFTGNGSGLANLNPSNLSSGTAGINITGNASNVTGVIAVANGGMGDTTAAGARSNLGAAKSGANSDITSLSGLTTPLLIGQGGTGSGTKNFVDLSTDQTISGTKTFSNQIVSSVATGGVPLQIASTTMVTNLNSEMVQGYKVADLDIRYGRTTPLQNPRSNTLTTVDSGYVGWYTSITVSPDGLPLISYYDSINRDLKVAKCGNPSCSSGNAIATIDSGEEVGRFTSITIGIDGLPIISYYDETNIRLKVAKCGNSSCSSSTITAVDSSGNVGVYTSITIGTDGLPIISYGDFSNGRLKVAKCGNSSCSSGNTIAIVDSSVIAEGFISITIGTDGLPIISYYDGAPGDLKAAKCGNSSCSSGNTITTLDSVGDVGAYASITIGIDGLPIISYHDWSNYGLKVAKCGNPSCSSGNTITTVDSGGGGYVGAHTSITIGSDGLPIISYLDETNYHLKVAKCGNSSCSSGNTIAIVDPGEELGEYTSITIGTDGLPIISYYAGTNGDLKIAKCANPFCLNNWSRR